MKLWHCYNARSLRPLWTLEELGLDYDIETLPFPPRVFQRAYLETNPLGTVPYFTDGAISMTESTAICVYLIEKYGGNGLGIAPDHPDYADYLNWLFQSDATLTFPQALVFRYSSLEPEDRRQPQVATDYAKWFLARLKRLNAHLETRSYLCDGRFTIADIAIGYALHFGEIIGFFDYYTPQVQTYLKRLQERDAFKRAQEVGKDLDPFTDLKPNLTPYLAT
ncbi:glutathione S-transferase family protein [uncultured Roseibium sp.]|uniref:glutathione S-transferase family protein n=1 Tax=uncultured Roseibium sp. TaxID=1936171 RepID=UPI003217BF40